MTGHDVELIALGFLSGSLGLLAAQWLYAEVNYALSQRERKKEKEFFRVLNGKLAAYKEDEIPLVTPESFEDEDVVS